MAQAVEAPALAGSAAEQALAQEILLVMRSRAASLRPACRSGSRSGARGVCDGAKLVTKDAAKAVEAAVRANPAAFALDGEGEGLTVITTSDGIAPSSHADGHVA